MVLNDVDVLYDVFQKRTKYEIFYYRCNGCSRRIEILTRNEDIIKLESSYHCDCKTTSTITFNNLLQESLNRFYKSLVGMFNEKKI